MHHKIIDNHSKIEGFMATTAVVLIAMGVLVLSLVTMSIVASYSDMVYRKESRIQARMNTAACLDTAILMSVKDYFINGKFELDQYDCQINIVNDFNGNISIEVKASLGGVTSTGNRVIKIGNSSVSVE